MNSDQIWMAALVPAAYLLGSIPFGLIVGLAKGVDPRKAGSGNIGATNVGRLLGGRYFALVFILDAAKGMLPMLAAAHFAHDIEGPIQGLTFVLWLAVGFGAIAGHMFSVFIGFKGGKGVATSAGVALGLFPYYTFPGLIAIGVWLGIFLVTRYVSLASVIAAVVFPAAYVAMALVRGKPTFLAGLPLLIFATLICVMVVWRHRSNLTRLREGTEHRFMRE